MNISRLPALRPVTSAPHLAFPHRIYHISTRSDAERGLQWLSSKEKPDFKDGRTATASAPARSAVGSRGNRGARAGREHRKGTRAYVAVDGGVSLGRGEGKKLSRILREGRLQGKHPSDDKDTVILRRLLRWEGKLSGYSKMSTCFFMPSLVEKKAQETCLTAVSKHGASFWSAKRNCYTFTELLITQLEDPGTDPGLL